VPEFLENRSFRVEPVELPVEAYYPGFKAFVQREEVARREAAVFEAGRALAGAHRRAAEAGQALAEVEGRLVPGNPRAFADPRRVVLAFPESTSAGADLAKARDAAVAAWLALSVQEGERAFAVADLAAIRARIAADRADPRHGGSTDSFEAARRAAGRAEQRATTARAVLEVLRADQAVAAARGKAEAEAAKAERFQAAARKALDMARAAIDQDPVTYSPISPVYPTRSTGRRRALASWIMDRANPLAARVAANHIWRWHFGTPLVATVFDFGRNGAAPTNRALLDWLASELIEPAGPGGTAWSMKALHRQIVLSAAYRMRSHTAQGHHPGRTIDPENRGYWQFPAARMEAEVVRDSLLHLAGGLDPGMGGPEIDLAQGLSARRRSLYFTHHGEARMPFLELFDAPDACDAYRRTTTIVPQQALALVNNDMLLALSRELADRLWAAADGPDPGARGEAFLTAAFEQVLTRRPSARERELTREFLEKQADLLGRDGDSDAAVRARRDLVHALFSHNDFITIH
jgi:hypothetical protein